MEFTKISAYFLIFILPIVLIVLGEVFFKYAFSSIQSHFIKSIVYGSMGIVLFLAICLTSTYAIQVLKLKPIFWGNGSSFVWGIITGVLISLVSGVGFGVLNGYSLQLKSLFLNFDTKLIANLYPALTEEAYFRGGIVNLLTQSFGQTIGLAAGSVPFGVIHIIGIFFGKTITIAQILGISLAGLMLSLMYLRFGLMGAVSCHLMWNAFVPGWAKVYGLENKNTVGLIEGSWLTCSILLIVSIVLYCSLPRA
jgi:membrane protease YdiL (CAAX protease family)